MLWPTYGLRTLRTVIVALPRASVLALVFKVPALMFLILNLWLSALFFFLCYLDKLVGNVINDSVYHALGLSLSLSLSPLSGAGCCPQLLHRLI